MPLSAYGPPLLVGLSYVAVFLSGVAVEAGITAARRKWAGRRR